ncbi:MAG: enoyl-CoA hydratase/isomerase family protein [Calditrichaceae bacterium]|jgi:enoyl-CoA hydratase/carnithine racemase
MQSLKFYQNDQIGFLLLTRPPKNEMDSLFFAELSNFLKNILPDLTLNGLIVHGEGRHFSSGANVTELADFAQKKEFSYFENNINYLESLSLCKFPVIAVINGLCLGSAFELALACHYRIASHHALFGLPEISFNLMPGCGGTYFLPKLIGKSNAIDLILSGRSVLADEALQIGIIDIIVDKHLVTDTAVQLINKLNSNNG